MQAVAKTKQRTPVNNDIPASYYELSADGLTLVKWTNTSTTSLDMQADSKLQKVNTIKANAFRNTKLQSINLPVNLKEIGDYAFINSSISTVTFNSASNITFGEAAFALCEKAEKAILPETIRIIGASAFSNCFVLSNITVKAFLEVPTLKRDNAFISGSSIRRNIYVPSRRVNDYKNAPNWSTWKDEITAIIE